MFRNICVTRASPAVKLFTRQRGLGLAPGTYFTSWSSCIRVRPLYNLMWMTTKISSRHAINIARRCGRLLVTDSAAAKTALVDSSPKAQRIVGYWFLGCSGLVFGAVMLGGITRLTESGLSMVDWHLIKGMRPPLTQADWEAEFAKYQQFPEYKYANQGMTLGEFKRIWYMEYAHRMWGRLIGTAFLLPAGYFWFRGYFNKGLKIRVGVLGSLVVAQGLLGWYMVKSGLDEEIVSKTEIPRVSQYRLASHLGLAFIAYAGMFWSGLGQILPRSQYELTRAMRHIRMWAHVSKGMVFLTAFSGAFVAGLDAGLVYNSWPKMAERWIPTDLATLSPGWKNIFENATTVQFDHRLLGHTTLGIITYLWFATRPLSLPGRARIAVNCMMGMVIVQVSLGILTLLYYVPTHLAATHQAGSLTLLSIALWLTHELRKPIVPK